MTMIDLDHVNIRTGNLAEMRRFYRDVLGLEDGERPSFRFDGAWLELDVRTARLQSGPLAAFTRWRFALGALGGVAIPLALLVAAPAVAPGWGTAGAAVAALAACLAGEGLERFLYFASSAPRAMPGRG